MGERLRFRLQDDFKGENLIANLTLFGRVLRRFDIPVTSSQLVLVIDAIGVIGFKSREDIRAGLRAVLINRRQDVALFDKLFSVFFQMLSERKSRIELGKVLQRIQSKEASSAYLDEASGDPIEERSESPLYLSRYSAQERLLHKDFAQLSEEELAEIRSFIVNLGWKLAQRRTRRKVRSTRGPYLDIRYTLKFMARTGSEPLSLRWRRPRLKPRPMVALCDVSGSMEPYSRILLQFLYGVRAGLQEVEVFAFGTRLTRITRLLYSRDIDRALQEAASAIQDFGGGTRIGEAIKNFNFTWTRRISLQSGTVMIISDGWDRGETQLLDREMARLQRNCRRLIWLNPLLGSPRYQPISRGIQAALPHIDDFLPVHNLASLHQLARVLKQEGGGSSLSPTAGGKLSIRDLRRGLHL